MGLERLGGVTCVVAAATAGLLPAVLYVILATLQASSDLADPLLNFSLLVAVAAAVVMGYRLPRRAWLRGAQVGAVLGLAVSLAFVFETLAYTCRTRPCLPLGYTVLGFLEFIAIGAILLMGSASLGAGICWLARRRRRVRAAAGADRE